MVITKYKNSNSLAIINFIYLVHYLKMRTCNVSEEVCYSTRKTISRLWLDLRMLADYFIKTFLK